MAQSQLSYYKAAAIREYRIAKKLNKGHTGRDMTAGARSHLDLASEYNIKYRRAGGTLTTKKMAKLAGVLSAFKS